MSLPNLSYLVQLTHNSNHTILQETRLGFIVSGQISTKSSKRKNNSDSISLLVSNKQLSSQLESFWRSEEIENHLPTKEESFCEKHLVENTFRDQRGRFVVSLPRIDHMQPVDSSQSKVPYETFYLPHHAVFRESFTTTKTRVVFDGSAKTSNDQSLNSILATGSVVQQDLFSIIIRFRTHRYVLSGDIPKMYRQIRINPQDFPLQRILWYDNDN
ncbi:uncharacterized protein LOC142329147 [Lycorma delicatula]|uniref:uncharacterized protein LOC142329147 n=1 Tax=Lycorma delicatula TaxID=130591 RepID=UPI003F519699